LPPSSQRHPSPAGGVALQPRRVGCALSRLLFRGLVRTGRRVPKASEGRRCGAPPLRLVFLFFSNRLGCLGSLLVSLVVTVILLLILGVINTN
jgi:hypothetical protein